MKKIISLCLPVFLFMTVSCGPSRDKVASQIQAMEQSLFAPESAGYNKAKADSLMSLYEDFIKDNPKDSLSPGFLFKAANIAMNSGDGNKALSLFDQYIQNYPDKPKAPLCLFFKAFIYENVLQNLDKARETYLLFIEKYPADEFVNDARMAIDNLGKSPEMLIKEFEAKQKADSIRVADSLAMIKKAGKHRKP
jgi:outer membrane protein assembly factor BamD (BamD/ComL family)